MKETIALIICALLLMVTGCSSSNEYAAPDDIAAFVDDYGEAYNRGDGSILDFYQQGGYHLYGDQRIAYDDIVTFMDTGWTSEAITDPLLVVDDGNGRYVVVCGIRNTSPYGFSAASAMNFEIARTADDGLKLVHTSWLYQHDL